MRFGFWVKIGEHPAIDHPDSSTGFQDSRIPLIHPFVENIVEELVELLGSQSVLVQTLTACLLF
jgi:hypothetical protein